MGACTGWEPAQGGSLHEVGACTGWEPAWGGSLHEAVFSSTLVQLKQNFDTTCLEKFPFKSLQLVAAGGETTHAREIPPYW